MTEAVENGTRQSKRPRLGQANPTAAQVDSEAAAAADSSSPHALVAVPVIGDQTGAQELLPALQQLLSVYQVGLECRHHTKSPAHKLLVSTAGDRQIK